MKLLVDANLSPRVAIALRERGFDVVHVADLDLLTATDDEIFDRAVAEGLVLSRPTVTSGCCSHSVPLGDLAQAAIEAEQPSTDVLSEVAAFGDAWRHRAGVFTDSARTGDDRTPSTRWVQRAERRSPVPTTAWTRGPAFAGASLGPREQLLSGPLQPPHPRVWPRADRG
jgi:hypothetical protein